MNSMEGSQMIPMNVEFRNALVLVPAYYNGLRQGYVRDVAKNKCEQ